MRYSTEELEKHIKEIYKKIEVIAKNDGIYEPMDIYFDRINLHGFDALYCFSDIKGYHFCFVERGTIAMHKKTKSLFEITYLILLNKISDMAWNYEKKNRVENKDFRRIAFSKRLNLFEQIGYDYKKRAEDEINEILKNYPFEDDI